MNNKNILELCLSYGLGGLEMFVVSCHETFSTNGVCKVVVAPESKLDKYLKDIDKFHIKRNKLFPLLPALKLAHYIDAHKIDIVHFHWSKDSITAVLAKLLSKRKPRLVQSRHMGMTRFKDDIYHKWLYKNIDMIHAVTKEVASQLEKFIPSIVRPQINMIYLGVKTPLIDTDKILQLQQKYALEKKFIIGIIGRIEEGKGQHILIEAIKHLKTPNITGLIVGDTMDEEYLLKIQKQAKEVTENNIIFTGFTKDVNEHIQLCDVVVLATQNETFGLIIIETMINKKTIIATNKGGPLEIINDGINGLLFDRSATDLADKISLLYTNKELINSIASQGYSATQEKFNKIVQMEKLFTTLKSL